MEKYKECDNYGGYGNCSRTREGGTQPDEDIAIIHRSFLMLDVGNQKSNAASLKAVTNNNEYRCPAYVDFDTWLDYPFIKETFSAKPLPDTC